MFLSLPSSSRVRALLPTTPEGASSGAELVTSDGRSLALVSATLRGEAQGGIARLVLEQRFENTYDENLRVTYRMPLPADGAVSGYGFEIGERVITGVVDRKQSARERFERAIVEGKTAALLEQDRADIFTQQIGNIPPHEAVIAKITIDQRLAWLPEGEWELRFPTVIGPRYIGSADTASDVRATHVKVTDQPLAVEIKIELAIRDAIVAGAKPNSPSHALEKRADGVIELKTGARLDRDIVVRWPVATPTVGLALAAARPPEGRAGNDAYGLVTIVPPARDAKATPVARDLLVLLDTSGSMGGGPLDKAKQVVAMMIDSLGEGDRLELIEFSNEPRHYKHEPIAATPRAKQDAIKWVRSRTADGGTEMRAAVIEALTSLRIGAQRQVVVVTDGYVGGERQILEVLHRSLPKSCRLHVLGVGAAVNRSLATSLSRAGRGAEVLVGIDEDAERAAKRLLDRTARPMLTNVEIAGSALLRHAPEHIPDVFEGAPLVAALALRAEGGELVVRGQLASGTWEQTIAVPAKRAGEGNQAIVALYGRERVADVETHQMFDSVDGEIEDLGLMFQIATRMTSWVAVDDSRRVTGPTRSQLIPQELPYGTKASAFGLRGSQGPMLAGEMQKEAGEFSDDLDESVMEGDALGGELEYESPTGQAQDKRAPVSRSMAPPPAQYGEAGPRRIAAKPLAEPAPSTPVPHAQLRGRSPEPIEKAIENAKDAKPQEEAKSAMVARPRVYDAPRAVRWLFLLGLPIVLALIAALLWWLFG